MQVTIQVDNKIWFSVDPDLVDAVVAFVADLYPPVVAALELDAPSDDDLCDAFASLSMATESRSASS